VRPWWLVPAAFPDDVLARGATSLREIRRLPFKPDVPDRVVASSQLVAPTFHPLAEVGQRASVGSTDARNSGRRIALRSHRRSHSPRLTQVTFNRHSWVLENQALVLLRLNVFVHSRSDSQKFSGSQAMIRFHRIPVVTKKQALSDETATQGKPLDRRIRGTAMVGGFGVRPWSAEILPSSNGGYVRIGNA
jgi:hypothetical protein